MSLSPGNTEKLLNLVSPGVSHNNFTKGRIALQSEGAEIHFKDVVIKALK